MMPEHSADDLFPVLRASAIDRQPASTSWLIEGLWTASAVGWVAGCPKVWKSWTALEMAVSVASGTPCLGRFAVRDRGKALIYLAEDSLPSVRERLEALACRRGLGIEELDIDVITVPSMRLDLGRDQVRLQKTARKLAPRLLVLDPLVRIHRSDENSSAEVSALLAYLRELQRELDLPIVVVHHVRKSAVPSQSAGQGLRGSGDLHAWSDSALYLKRRGDTVVVTIEHRSAPAPQPLAVRLVEGVRPYLEIVDGATKEVVTAATLEDAVLAALRSGPLTRSALRDRLSVRNERLGSVLDALQSKSSILRTADGWQLADAATAGRSGVPSIGMNGNGTIGEDPYDEYGPPCDPMHQDDDIPF